MQGVVNAAYAKYKGLEGREEQPTDHSALDPRWIPTVRDSPWGTVDGKVYPPSTSRPRVCRFSSISKVPSRWPGDSGTGPSGERDGVDVDATGARCNSIIRDRGGQENVSHRRARDETRSSIPRGSGATKHGHGRQRRRGSGRRSPAIHDDFSGGTEAQSAQDLYISRPTKPAQPVDRRAGCSRYGYLKTDWKQAGGLDLYTRQYSIGVKTPRSREEVATMAGDGQDPVPDMAVSTRRRCRRSLAVMATAGTSYDIPARAVSHRPPCEERRRRRIIAVSPGKSASRCLATADDAGKTACGRRSARPTSRRAKGNRWRRPLASGIAGEKEPDHDRVHHSARAIERRPS